MSTAHGPDTSGRTSEQERETLTVEEAARRLGIGRTLCYELARRGEIPVLKLGNRFVVPKAALDRLLAASGDA